MILSPSMPCTSVMWVTLREPSRMRDCWTMTSTAEEICSRMARTGRSMPAMSTIVSSRASMSRGVLAWPVVSEPSWPVFIAWSMSRASPPRHSPTMTRSGRMRRVAFMQSRAVTAPVPSMLAGRVSRRIQCSLASCNSAESSIDDDALVVGDEVGEHVEQGGLARAGAAGDDDVQSGDDAGAQKLGDLRRDRAEADQVVDTQLLFGELPNGDGRTDQRDGRDDDVDARAIGQAGIDDGRGLVDVSTERRDDAVDDAADVVVVVELDIAQQEAALALEVDLLGAVDHDLGDGGVVEQGLDRAEADDVGGELLEEALLLGAGEDQVFGLDDLVEEALEALADLVDPGRIHRRVELADQLALDALLETALRLVGFSGLSARGFGDVRWWCVVAAQQARSGFESS